MQTARHEKFVRSPVVVVVVTDGPGRDPGGLSVPEIRKHDQKSFVHVGACALCRPRPGLKEDVSCLLVSVRQRRENRGL